MPKSAQRPFDAESPLGALMENIPGAIYRAANDSIWKVQRVSAGLAEPRELARGGLAYVAWRTGWAQSTACSSSPAPQPAARGCGHVCHLLIDGRGSKPQHEIT